MHDAADGPADEFEAALQRIRDRIAARTREGIYPPGMDAELDGHFERLAAMGRLDDAEPATTAIANLRHSPALGVERISIDSRIPGGQKLHRSVQLVVGRQLVGVLDQVEQFRHDVISALEAVLDHMEPIVPSRTEVVARLAGLADRVSRVDQALVAIRGLERRVAELEDRESDRSA